MGKSATGEKRKFDWIATSKTKKYKIITAVVLVIGVLFLGLGLLMQNMQTAAVVPNRLEIVDGTLSGLVGGKLNTYNISQDETIVLTTGTVDGRPLTTPIEFFLLDGAEEFLEIYDSTNTKPITSSHYSGLFYLHIRDNAPGPDENNIYPSGILRITCGSYALQINLTYYKKN